MNLAQRTRNFWCAAYFYRRAAPERDRKSIPKILKHVAAVTTGNVQKRADQLLKEIENVQQHSRRHAD